jgi:hypothetical protein
MSTLVVLDKGKRPRVWCREWLTRHRGAAVSFDRLLRGRFLGGCALRLRLRNLRCRGVLFRSGCGVHSFLLTGLRS